MAWHGSINSHELTSTTCCSSHLSLPAPIRSKYFVVLLVGSNETCVCGGGSHTVYMRAAGVLVVLVGGRVYFRGPRTPPSRFSCPASVNCLLNTILESHAFFHHPALYCSIKSQPHTIRHTFFQSFLFCRISSLITANSELPSIKQIWIQIMKD